ATADARVPLDLGRVPLFRARLVRLAPEQYRLQLTLHHIIFDGVAIYRVFLPELTALYQAFAAGKPSPLPEVPIQYADYACWERKNVTAESVAADMEQIRRQLPANLPEVYLPADHPRPRQRTFRGSMYPFTLGAALTSALREFGRKHNFSMFHLLLAGFAALLGRYSGLERIPIGIVTAGRNHRETEALLGYFLNTVLVPAELRDGTGFRELARLARGWTLQALDRERVPFEYLLRELKSQRQPDRNPLFQALFSLEPPMRSLPPEWRITQMDVDTGTSKYDLYLEMDERPEKVLARFHYSRDLFEASTIRRMLGHFENLLREGLERPDTPVGELNLMSAEERAQVVVEWNRTEAEYPREVTIAQAFEQQVERTPEATALVFEGRRWTYREVNEEANRLARVLQKRGLGEGSLVGILLERSAAMVTALLAVLKAGAAYVPLDPAYPPERIRFVQEDAGLTGIIAEAATRDRVPGGASNVVVLEECAEIAGESRENLPGRVSSEQRAYVIYTSGSTGTPKGVEGTHRGAMNRFSWMWRTYPFQADEVCCQKTNLGFVDSIWEIFGPLLAGIANVILPPATVRDPEQFLQVLAEEGVSRIVLVPSQLRALLEHAPKLGERVPGLKLW